MDSSDEELLNEFATQWDKNLMENDPNDLFYDSSLDTNVNDLPDSGHLKVLFQKFGHKKFRPLQWKIISSILTDKKDNCAIMFTGYGKSLCYQFPAVYSKGITLVISPLISLMGDQVLSLTMKNISSCLLGTAQSNSNIYDQILENKYSLVYLTPEFCTCECGLELLKNMRSKLQITLIAVDEAHCVSSWGHDFRPSYRRLGILKDIFFDTPVLAVTATATEQVKKDIINSLKLKNPQVLCSGYDRPNLYFSVRSKSKNILEDLKSLMIRIDSRWVFKGSTIIYCITRKDTEEITNILKFCGVDSVPYHAGMSLKARREAHENFVKDKVPVIVATIAFGMGIDKPDIRNIIHYGASGSIESYYQEVGRAGRDGLPSKCITFYCSQDFCTRLFLITRSKNKNKSMKLFHVMKEYLTTRECRRQFIISYFTGSPDLIVTKKFDCCDNCSQKYSLPENERYGGLAEKKMFDFTEDAVKFLSAVNAMNGSFGIALYVLFLRASKSSRIYEKFRRHPCYGSGYQKPEEWWKAIADFLEAKKYLIRKLQKKGKIKYFVVDISEEGCTFLQEASCGKKLLEQPTTDLLKLLQKRPHCSGWISADGSGTLKSVQTLEATYTKTNNDNCTSIKELADPETQEVTENTLKIFRLLKNCRTQLAADNCMPYMIASDFVLMEIAKRRPFDLQELRNMHVEGLTDAIISRFGANFLRVVINNTDGSIYNKNIIEICKSPILDILRDHPLKNFNIEKIAPLISHSYFKNGFTLEKIAEERNLSRDTVFTNLISALKMGYPIKMELLGVNPRSRTTIIQVINNLGGQYSIFAPIMRACPNEITYEQVKVVCSYLEIRAHLEKIGIPYEEFEDFVYSERTTSPNNLNNGKTKTLLDSNNQLLLALCDAMENQVSDATDLNNMNKMDDEGILENVSSSSAAQDFTCSQHVFKKRKIETNTALNSPPRGEIPKDVTVEDIYREPEKVKAFEQAGLLIKIQKDKSTVSKTKKALPQWLSKKRKS